jgi:hypothetical protein
MSRSNRNVHISLLIALSGDLAYEIWMLDNLKDALSSERSIPVWLNNCLIESFAIHARVLIEFFYGHGSKPNDARSTDYVTVESLRSHPRPRESSVLKEVRNRTGYQVSHLSYSRTDVRAENKEWNYIAAWQEIDKLIRWFVCCAEPGCLGTDFRKIIKKRHD